MKEPFDELRANMKEIYIGGSLYIRRFDDFDGNFKHIILIYILTFYGCTCQEPIS